MQDAQRTRNDRGGAGSQHQIVVFQVLFFSVLQGPYRYLSSTAVDLERFSLEANINPFYIFKIVPIAQHVGTGGVKVFQPGDLPSDIKRYAARTV